MNVRTFLRCLIALALLGAAPAVFAQAQPGLPLLTGTAGGQSYSLPVQT
ncbi:flagellar biosynthetic protein FliP, partial [Corallococcus exiguus]|nr:flagellar biosynthetic protein FliP [Corallococcus exiguus]